MPQLQFSVPEMSVEDAGGVLAMCYGLRGEVRALPGERDSNFLLRTADARTRVLKIANPDDDRALLEMQNAALAHVAAMRRRRWSHAWSARRTGNPSSRPTLRDVRGWSACWTGSTVRRSPTRAPGARRCSRASAGWLGPCGSGARDLSPPRRPPGAQVGPRQRRLDHRRARSGFPRRAARPRHRVASRLRVAGASRAVALPRA